MKLNRPLKDNPHVTYLRDNFAFDTLLEDLTSAEQDLVLACCAGIKRKDIAAECNISCNTLWRQMKRLRLKLGYPAKKIPTPA